MITLADALGAAARPLAAVLAHWRHGPAWRRRLIRRIYPDLAIALDDLASSFEVKIGPL